MNKECQGCYLLRIFTDETLYEPVNLDHVSCGYQNFKCPCKICLVKVTCNIIEGGSCDEFIKFNVKHRKD